MSTAKTTMSRLNGNALIGTENGFDVMIEDFADTDGRIYRIEYQSTPDGEHAVAFCRFNPWGGVSGGEEYEEGHVDSDGFICVGKESIKSVARSPHSLEFVIARARYWCTGFSALKESGQFPNPE